MNGILNQSIVVKGYDFNNPDIDEVDFLLDKVNKNCRRKHFHSFEYRRVWDLIFTDLTNKEEVINNWTMSF